MKLFITCPFYNIYIDKSKDISPHGIAYDLSFVIKAKHKYFPFLYYIMHIFSLAGFLLVRIEYYNEYSLKEKKMNAKY